MQSIATKPEDLREMKHYNRGGEGAWGWGQGEPSEGLKWAEGRAQGWGSQELLCPAPDPEDSQEATVKDTRQVPQWKG